MQTVELYISDTKIDLFQDEKISITDSIQNVIDISKVFTAFSQSFTVPASKKNNKFFKHYYNPDISNGFDARVKVSAEIKLNGFTYKKGKIQLTGVSLKDNTAFSYSIVFFGETVILSDLFKGSKLDVLGPQLAKYNHYYSTALVSEGLRVGLGLVSGSMVSSTQRDVVYALNSHTKQFIFDSTTETISTATEVNLYRKAPVTGNTYGLNFTDLKPAIKCELILQAIEEKYNLVFDRTGFFSNASWTNLYLLLNRNKGVIIGGGTSQTKIIYLSEWVPFSYPLEAQLCTSDDNNGNYNTYELSFEITPVPLGKKYTITVRDEVSGDLLGTYADVIGVQTINITLEGARCYEPSLSIASLTADVSSFTPSFNLSRYSYLNLVLDSTASGTFTTSPTSNAMVSNIVIADQMPDLLILDFLTSIFKTFNLTAYVKDDIIYVKTLDVFYASGTTYDITKYVDISTSNVDRALPYSQINFANQEPTTLLGIQFKTLYNSVFGGLNYTAGEGFDGGVYEIKTSFERLIYERLNDNFDNNQTEISYAFLVDDKTDPTLTKPVIFFNINQTTAQPIGVENIAGTGLTTYNRMSNVLSDNSQTLNFGIENDEFLLTFNEQSLFANFYNTYISSVFKKSARITKVKAYLPLSFLLKYTLADVVIIKNKSYKINSITTDLQTGLSNLELL